MHCNNSTENTSKKRWIRWLLGLRRVVRKVSDIIVDWRLKTTDKDVVWQEAWLLESVCSLFNPIACEYSRFSWRLYFQVNNPRAEQTDSNSPASSHTTSLWVVPPISDIFTKMDCDCLIFSANGSEDFALLPDGLAFVSSVSSCCFL